MHDCFISYSHKDAQIAVVLQNLLEQHGIRCWIDFRDALPGADYAGSIVRAIKSAKFFILVLSKNSSSSHHVINEINSAANAEVTILPLKVDESELNDSMEYYLGKTHWMDVLTPPLEKHITKLVGVINSHKNASHSTDMQKKYAPYPVAEKPVTSASCRMVKYQDLLSLGYSSATISLQLVENDYINCNGIGTENEGTAQQWEEYLQDNSETFQYMINADNKIVGDWSIVALTEEAFDLAMAGQLLEAEIDIDKTELICFPGIYQGYILALSILPEYRNMKNYNLLIESFLAQLEEYAENGIFFKKWCINVFSREVESLVKQLGFRYVTKNNIFGKIYSCEFMPMPNLPIYRKHSDLMQRYQNVQL